MSDIENSSLLSVAIPNDFVRDTLAGADPTANDFGERVVTVETTHGVMILPLSWRGQHIRIHNTHATALLYVAASEHADAEVAPGSAAAMTSFTATSFTSTAGRLIPAATATEMYIPMWDVEKTCYLVAEASAQLVMRIGLGRAR